MPNIKAVQSKSYGGPEQWFLGHADIPLSKKDCVLVKLQASSMNPIDWKLRQGMLKIVTGIRPPKTPGSDVAGVVIGLGPKVSRFNINDRVFGMVPPAKGGAWAEQVWVPEKQLEIIPEATSFEQAAAVPLAGMTAFQALVSVAKVRRGMTVFIRGCTGGVGVFAVQVAKAKGAKVIGACRGENVEFAASLGVDDVVNYEKDPELRTVSDCDIFFDVHGGASKALVQSGLKNKGVYLTTQPYPKEWWRSLRSMFTTEHRRHVIVLKQRLQDLKAVATWLASGDIQPHIGAKYSMADIEKAAKSFEAGGIKGKVVITGVVGQIKNKCR